jgi:hypothetical protein
MQGTRGGNFYASFNSAATLTNIDALVYLSASNTVNEFSAAGTSTVIPIGTLVQKSTGGAGTPCTVDLFHPTKKGIAGAGITAGARLVAASSTNYLITAAGTLTANPIIGQAVTGAAGIGIKFEYFPYIASGVVIA